MKLMEMLNKPNSLYSKDPFEKGVYKKALLVIDSCENEYHLKGAEKYINNFLMQNSKQIDFRTFESDKFYLKMFGRLKDYLNEKRLKITVE